MVSRRQVLGTIGGATLLGTAGCVEFVTGDGLFYESAQAIVSEETLNETGYSKEAIDSFGIDESISALGISRTVEVTNWQAEYERSGRGRLGEILDETPYSFVAVSTPQASVLGQEVNPVGNMDVVELIDRVEGQYDGITNIEEHEEVDATVLDEDTILTRFEAEIGVSEIGEIPGIDALPLIVEITEAVESEDDLVLTVAIYPNVVQYSQEVDFIDNREENPGEEEAVTLRNGVEHP